MKFKNRKNLNKNGFTIIEVMAAVMVLSVGIIGGLTLITYNLKNISSGGKRIIATGLVEDGLERVRNVRDTNWLKENDWDESIQGIGQEKYVKIFCGNNEVVDMSTPDPAGSTEKALIDDCVADGNCAVYVYAKDAKKCYGNDFGASYPLVSGYTRGVFSQFYRLIHVENIPGVEAIKITVIVRWAESGQNKYLSAEEVLYNWQ